MNSAQNKFLAICTAGYLLEEIMTRAQSRCGIVACLFTTIELARDEHPTDQELVKLGRMERLPRPTADALIQSLRALSSIKLLPVFAPGRGGVRFDSFARKIAEQYPPIHEIEAMAAVPVARRSMGRHALPFVDMRVGQWIQPPEDMPST